MFIYHKGKLSKIKLSNNELNKFDINSKEFQIELDNEILQAIKNSCKKSCYKMFYFSKAIEKQFDNNAQI